MPKISVIIPVFKAEKYLRRCVESIIFGQERDLEVILVEDCSPDGSWDLCRKLAEEYQQVRCLQNKVNSGVSYTRNQGLKTASGKYVLFVDSDDWVSSSYVKSLVETYEANPGKMVVCGYWFIDHTTNDRVEYGMHGITSVPCKEFSRLQDAVLLQQLWNKLFVLDVIRKNNICFNEEISMGEDFQFVLDVIEAMDYKECIVINKPLYYYIRWNNNSLMSRWSELEHFDEVIRRAEQMRKIGGGGDIELDQIRQQYVGRIANDRLLTVKEKLDAIERVMKDGSPRKHYRSHRTGCLREQAGKLRRNVLGLCEKISGKFRTISNKQRIASVRKGLRQKELTIISQNCIGGVFSHDMGLEFRSPTVNLFLPAADFIKFVDNLQHYLNAKLELSWGETYPIGKLADIELHFVHYETCEQAQSAWERRKKRVDFSKIVVLSTDRDGFDGEIFEKWKQIPYPKLLFTARKEFASDADSVYFPEYEQDGCVQDLIPKRKFYKDGKLLSMINNAHL